MQFRRQKRLFFISGLLGTLIIVVGGWLLYHFINPHKVTIDTPLQKTLENVASITSYSQFVETRAKIGSRTLKIVGIYANDTKNKYFTSYSTTTLYIEGDPKLHVFTHENIAIDDTVYVRVQTTDPLLKSSIQSSPQWRSFKSNAIPKEFGNIAIAGPIQDNLAILGNNGAYLVLIKKYDSVTWGDETLARYNFTLSQRASAVGDGPLNALVGRVGPGTIDIWIDPVHFAVRHLVFTNGSYTSTTTISNSNVPLTPAAPIVLTP